MTSQISRNLARARNVLGINSRPAATGVGAVFRTLPSFAAGQLAAANNSRAAAMTVPAAILQGGGGVSSPAMGDHGDMHIADRASWAKRYAGIEIPVDSTVDAPLGVVPGATLDIEARTQVTVWITNFVADTDEPSDFLITLLQISRTNLIAGGGGVPASRFRGNNTMPFQNMEVLAGGSFALIGVKNINKAATLDFHGTLVGLDMSRPISGSL